MGAARLTKMKHTSIMTEPRPIPLSLYVTIEIVNYCQAYFIDQDVAMFDPVSGEAARARSSNMNADLGQIAFVFSDKTGTLTQNEMRFRRAVVGFDVYGAALDGGGDGDDVADDDEAPPLAVLRALVLRAAAAPAPPGRASSRWRCPRCSIQKSNSQSQSKAGGGSQMAKARIFNLNQGHH